MCLRGHTEDFLFTGVEPAVVQPHITSEGYSQYLEFDYLVAIINFDIFIHSSAKH